MSHSSAGSEQGAVPASPHRSANGHMFGSSDHADSAGQPWAGRSFGETSFSGDDGSTPPALIEPLRLLRSDSANYPALIALLAAERVLVPLLAETGDHGINDRGLKVDKTQELSIVTVIGPDGRTVLPVFTSVSEMQHWNAQARPVPVDMIRVALAAAEEDTELVVVNPTSASEFVIRRPALWAIAQSKISEWLPSWADQELLDEFAGIAAQEPHIAGIQLLNGDPEAKLHGPELVVVLALRAGLDREVVNELVQRLSEFWAASTLITERVDSLAVKLIAAQ
ncbi:MAG: SseB family protein [Microbacteriaceae bacterium]